MRTVAIASLVVLLSAVPVSAQVTYYYNPIYVMTPGGSSVPPTCTSGDRFYLTAGDVGIYVCGGNNVWAKLVTTTSTAMLFPWGTLTGTLSSQTDLQTALNAKGTSNFDGVYASLTGKPTLGTAAATASTDYATSAQGTTANSALQPAGNGSALTGLTKTQVGLANVDNTSDANKPVSSATQTALNAKQATLVSATNIKTINGSTVLGSGDLVVGGAVAWGGITGTLSNQTDLQTALNGKQASGSYATGTGTANGTNTGDQTITLTGNVTGTGTGSFAATIANSAVTLAKMADMATASLIYRKTAGTGAPEVNTLATVKTDLALVKGDVGLGSVDNTADASKSVSSAATLTTPRTINGTSFNGSANITLGTASVTLAQLADMATASVYYRKTAATGVPEVQSLATLKTDLGLTGTNSGDQTITLTGGVTGTGTGSFAATVVTNANLTGVITSSGNATSIASQTGTGTKFVTDTSPTLVTPVLGVATGTSFAATGAVTSSGTAGIGYATGAGGTITQLTNKSTTVILNKLCGTITMNGAALAAATIVTFTVTDSTVAATDVIATQHDSAGTIGAYTVTANTSAAGSFKISIRNNTAGSLSEAIVIRFVVVKAVAS